MVSVKEIFDENIMLGKAQAHFYEMMHPQIFNVIEQRRLQRVIGNLTKKVDTHPPALDIGSGTGNVARFLSHCGFIYDGREHLKKNLKGISIEKVAPYFESSKKSTLSDIFSNCFKEARITWNTIPYRNGHFIIGRKTLKSNDNIKDIKKFKILFVPTNSREIDQFDIVRRELKSRNCDIHAIALNKNMEKLLQENGFNFKHIKDYKTRNLLNILRREKPDLIVTDFCGPIANAFLFASNYMCVPALQIDDGITADYSALIKIHPKLLFQMLVGWIASEVMLRGKPLSSFLITLWAINSPLRFLRKAVEGILNLSCPVPVPSSVEGLNIAVMSQFAKDAYIKMGFPPEKIFVTGQPRFDMVRQKKFNKNQLMTELSISENKGLVVLATQPLVGSIWAKQDRKKFIEVVCDAMREFPDKQLVIKLHPSENMKTYQKILANRGKDKAIVCRDIDLYELLHACELLMTVHSTVALEAMIFDKPVITINLTGKPDLMPYAKSGAAIGVYKEEDLVPAIRDALYSEVTRKKLKEARKKFVYEHAYIQDGKASERVANLIIQLMKGNMDYKRR
jgi:glycosyltransferase involved in cell wall biosynthesis